MRSLHFRRPFLSLILVAILWGTALPSNGDITNVTCAVTQPADLTKKYNVGQNVILKSTWASDSGPFAATFKVGGVSVGSVNTSGKDVTFLVAGSQLSEGSNQFSAAITEMGPGGTTSPDAPANGSVTMDKTAPTITLTVTSGSVVSPVSGSNEVIMQFTSNEALGAAPKFKVSPAEIAAVQADPAETPPYTSGRYKLVVPAGTAGGGYTVQVTAVDDTLPETSRNQSAAQCSFTVDSAADGAPVIHSCSPKTPFRTESLTLTGALTAENGTQKVEVLENGAVKGTTSVGAGIDNWTIVISPVDPGPHTYTARRTDALGNVSAESPRFAVVADRTPPNTPILDKPLKNPTNQTTVTITGANASDTSGPVKIKLMSEEGQIGSATADSNGVFTCTNVKLKVGMNVIMAQAADTTYDGTGDSGNVSGYSGAITITVDQTAPQVVNPGGVMIAVPGTSPTPPSVRTSTSPAPSGQVAKAPLPSRMLFAPPTGKSGESSSVNFKASAPAGNVEKPGTKANASGEKPKPTSFQLPIGNVPSSRTEIFLPLSAVRDRDPRRVQAAILARRFFESPTVSYKYPMSLTPEGFKGYLPITAAHWVYRIMLVDRAGNVSYFPDSGEFVKRSARSDTLKLQLVPSRILGNDPGCDEWPLQTLGMPPVDRLMQYRRIVVHPDHIEDVKSTLAGVEGGDAIEVEELRPNLARKAAFQRDIGLLQDGTLPRARLDLLISDIVNGEIPLELLPDPKEIPAKPGFEKARDSIRFRQLHEKPR